MVDFAKLIEKNRAARALAAAGVDIERLASVKVDDSPDAMTVGEELERIVNEAVEAAPKIEPKPIVLSDEQERVLAAAREGGNILITGGAGTGKSTLLKQLVLRLDGRLPVTASTGIAAVGVEGVTIHSYAGLGMGDEPLETIIEKVCDRRRVVERLRAFNRLAIDEISMVSADLMNKLDGVLKAVRKNHLPFGGMQIIAFGDFLQLPPVTRGEQPEGKFAFQSRAWREANFRVFVLQKVFRQEDVEFARALAAVRVGKIDEAAGLILRSRYRQKDPDPAIEPVVVHTTNADVDATNQARLIQLPEPELHWRAFDSGEPHYLTSIQKHCLAPEILKLRVGAQVMLLKNLDVEAGLANGSIGKVVRMPKESVLGGPVVEFRCGQTRSVERAKWEIKLAGDVVAQRQQIPLRLAWSITTHKSQGLTLDKIRVHLGNVFEDGQAYVALSRARTLDGLFIESTSKGCVRANPDAVRFYEEQA